MNANNRHNTASLILVSLFLVGILVAAYFAINDLAGKQSQQHQQSISPVFSLIERELIAPLQVAHTLSSVGIYDEYFVAENPNKEKLVRDLRKYSSKFNLEFYLAHDKSRKQFNSDGRVFDLIEGKVIWYFALKDETDSQIQAVLGNRENPHLYIDVRQYDDQGEFIGFVGVGKSLQDFLDSFQEFRQKYGHEFLFVNNNEEIVLSSIPVYSPEQADNTAGRIGIKTTQDIPWFKEFTSKAGSQIEPSVIVNHNDSDLLVSMLALESLNWSLYVLTPLEQRQQEVNQSFAVYFTFGLLVFFLLYIFTSKILNNYFDRYSKRINQDPLTKLSNREYANLYFNRVRKQQRQIAVIVFDLDDFKLVNDKYGHTTGDIVLKNVADRLTETVGNKGLAVRWGGEEFTVVLPGMDANNADLVAQNLRKTFVTKAINTDHEELNVTASFGVFSSRDYSDTLDKMVHFADIAMYQAKQEGKNKVVNANKTTLKGVNAD